MKLKDFDFRIWNKDEVSLTHASKDWKLDIGFSNPQQDYGKSESELHAYYDGEPMCPSDCEIELWSGFYDCKGVKMYENDIVSCDNVTYQVVYERGVFWVKNNEHNLIMAQAIHYEPLEVIGNIHENAELLKKEKSAFQM